MILLLKLFKLKNKKLSISKGSENKIVRPVLNLDQRTFKNVRLPRLMNFSTPVK